MRFQFDAHQAYQIAAIDAVADLFEGQLRSVAGELFDVVAANRLDLADDDLLAHLQAIQARNSLPQDATLIPTTESIETADGKQTATFPNFSVEMETGTGKTYVYIRTALELYRRYGFRKFIIVVPSVAVREGVLKTFDITRQHLSQLYDNTPYRAYVYDSDNLTRVRNFAQADSVEFMVMTIDSFNKTSNIFRQSTDHLMGDTPIHLVQATRPILILDEPQNMESEKSIAALAALNPLFALRYSATHRNPYNLVYRLTPADAYRERLVKRIEVAGMIEQDDIGQAYIRVEGVEAKKSVVTARAAIHKLMKDGTVKEQTITLRPDVDLAEATGRTEYAGFVVEEIGVDGEYVRFVNGVEVKRGVARGPDREKLFAEQIRYTIEEHMRRQARLRAQGIKVLTLFFIDRVESYVSNDGLIRRLFVGAFERAKATYPDWRGVDAANVHQGYFAQKRVKGETEWLDSVSGKTAADEGAYDLIMRDKERLLSFDEPVAFIFSHSALREGWDNPNVFQICTLNQSVSELRKRQEIGRGMRLAVDQTGERVRDEGVNVLTVVANESYDTYVRRLQQEISDEFGAEGLPPAPVNARQKERNTARLRKGYTLSDEFKNLWERIRQKTRYSVRIDTAKLIADTVAEVDGIRVRPPRIAVTKARVDVDDNAQFQAIQMSSAKAVASLAGRAPLPNLIALIENLMERVTPPVRISRRTLLAMLSRTTNLQAACDNPQEFATEVMRILKERLADQLADGIHYEKIDEWYEMSQFDDEIVSTKQLVPAQRSLYDHIACDSQIERDFVDGLEHHDAVKLYVKLPNWFTVRTPIGDYNPDWAIVMEDRDAHAAPTETVLYLVRETKSTLDLHELRADERRKIICGAHHFTQALGQDYQVVTSVSQLPHDGRVPIA